MLPKDDVQRVSKKVSDLIKLIWDEFYLCDPNATKSCPCGKCFGGEDLLDQLLEDEPKMS